jgi:CheY-like chemotaxis protein
MGAMETPKSHNGSNYAKILVLDDHPNMANMLPRGISQLGPRVEVVSVTSGPKHWRRWRVARWIF